MTANIDNNDLSRTQEKKDWVADLFAFLIPFLLVGGWTFFIHAIRGPAIFDNDLAEKSHTMECWTGLFVFGGIAGSFGFLIYKLVRRALTQNI